MPPPRILACNPIGTVLGVASELVECGRARYQKGDLEEARAAFEEAVQRSTDRALLREGRYWLGEALIRLGRARDAERPLTLVAQEDPRGEFGFYATHALGWVSLELGDAGRALGYFDRLLKGGAPPALIAYARHGRAMALYGLRRHAEARDEWAGLLGQGAPRPVALEAAFWLGDTLGRLGDPRAAVPRLQTFTAGGPQALIDSGLLRLGWWSRAAGQPLEAIKAYRAMLTAYPSSPEARWARVGLALALADLDDFAAARAEARWLETADPRGDLAVPVLLAMARAAAERGRAEEAQEIASELLGRSLGALTRSWVLLLSAEVARRSGRPDEARDRFELVRQSQVERPHMAYAALRLAQLDFDARDFAQALAAAEPLLGESLTPEVRAAALLLAGEAAYWARQYDRAAGFYARFLSEQPQHLQAPAVMLALGWAELRRGRLEIARQRWTAFAQAAPGHPHAAAALLLSAELAARAGDVPAAQALLDQVLARYPGTEHADLAVLNRALLAIREGRGKDALGDLESLARRSAASLFRGRIRAARGVALLQVGQFSEAGAEFGAALGQGEEALARLGLASAAMLRRQWPEAVREFAAARDLASGPAAAAAEYGLAAVAFNQGRSEEFKQFAAGLLASAPDPGVIPAVLAGMAHVAAQERQWPEARGYALRLVGQYPRHQMAAGTVGRLAGAAAAAEQWALAREMYQTLAARYPELAGRVDRMAYAETLLRTGGAAEARGELETFVTAAAGDPRLPRALLLLAEAREAAGDRAGAYEIYARLSRQFPAAKELPMGLLAEGRLLLADGRWSEARGLLERAVESGDARVAAEAAFHLGEGWRAAGKHEEAVEAYMTAAYMAPDIPWGRRALLGAGQAFTALERHDSAAIVYRKLLAAPQLEPALAEQARKALAALGAR
jgi:TolA-binding protein